jgi:hypothetical protein
MFLFLSLALLKRYVELLMLDASQTDHGPRARICSNRLSHPGVFRRWYGLRRGAPAGTLYRK